MSHPPFPSFLLFSRAIIFTPRGVRARDRVSPTRAQEATAFLKCEKARLLERVDEPARLAPKIKEGGEITSRVLPRQRSR
jgi:hypothetical protein